MIFIPLRLRSLVLPWVEEMTQRLSHSVKRSEVSTLSEEISAWLTERAGHDIEDLLRQAKQLQRRLPTGVLQHGTKQFRVRHRATTSNCLTSSDLYLFRDVANHARCLRLRSSDYDSRKERLASRGMKGKTVVSATTGDVIPRPYRSSPRHPLYPASSSV